MAIFGQKSHWNSKNSDSSWCIWLIKMRQSLLVKKHMFGSYTKKDVGTSSQLVTASENNMNPNFRFNKLFSTCNNGAQDVHTMPCCQIVHDLLSCCLALNKIFSISTYFDHFQRFWWTKKYFRTEKRVLPPAMVDFHILMRELVE